MLFSYGCEEHPKYSSHDGGVKWKMLAFSDAQLSLDSAEQYFLEYIIHPLHTEDTLAFQFDQLIVKGNDPFRRFIQSRSVGDSLEILTCQKDTLNSHLPFKDTLLYRVRIDRMRTRSHLNNRRLQELVLLDSLIRQDSVRAYYREVEGGYYRSLHSDDTTQVRRGKEIVIHYQGRTIDGQVFDDSRRMSSPLRFVLGNEGQVLKGLEVALSQMRNNEVSEIILPSWLAFGSKGSADGRVSPFTPVVYTVEVLEVSKH